MKKAKMKLLLPLFFTVLLSACFGPETPEEVSETFWIAVVNNDADDAAKYSTLTQSEKFDAFEKNWNGYQLSLGQSLIEANRASIITEFVAPANSEKQSRSFTTYLVRVNDEWVVDYDRTATDVKGGIFGKLVNQVERISDDISVQLIQSKEAFGQEMERLSDELEKTSQQWQEKAAKGLKELADDLQRNLDDLQKSIERALEDEKHDISDDDRQVLVAVEQDIERDKALLDDPTVESVVISSKQLAKAQYKLQSTNSPSLDAYKKEWNTFSRKFQQNVKAFLDSFSS